MESYFALLAVYLVFLGSMMAPGPDLLIAMRNALGYSARSGVYTAAGIALALSVHIGYSIAGLGLIISQSIILFNLIKFIGAGYLIFIGYKALRSKGYTQEAYGLTEEFTLRSKSNHRSFMDGVVTNLFNPKATLFFVALFSQMIDPAMAWEVKAIFGVACMVSAFIWFSTVSLVMGVPVIRGGYMKASKWIDRVFGGFFIALGGKLMLSKAN